MKGGKRIGAGRPVGSKNKTQEQIREFLQELVSENIELISEDLKTLKPEQRIKYIIELSKFVLPQLRSVENLKSNNPEFNTIIVKYADEVKPT